MPANLTPEYKEAERAYREAKTPEAKLHCLEFMLSVIPKHKGTEKIQAELKKKIARLARDDKKKGASSRRSSMFNVPREGAGQVVMAGAPNSGKSSLLSGLTNANPEIAEYPYTTMKPQPGMIKYQNIRIQLVDLPPISKDYTETWIPGVARNADLALLLVNLGSDDVLEETEFVINRLLAGKVELVDKVTKRFKPDGTAQVKTRMVCTHADLPGTDEILDLVLEVFGNRFPHWRVCAREKESMSFLGEEIFKALEIVRVYTKSPGKPPDKTDPVTLPIGSTVMEFATDIHKDFASNLKYARIWGRNKYDGQKVPRDYELMDEDVVELHD